jgi:prepilin signal peptidase PulO-like enzyme (type II secretory pathway)
MSSDDIALLAVAVAGIAGLFIGSFLNVVVYRVPLGLSVAQPRSFCPTCRHQLSWWENVPVVSWVGLRGRCRSCHQAISVRYPLVELTTGILFSLVTWAWNGGALSVGYCLLTATMVAVGLIEYSGQRAPLSVAAIGTGSALLIIVAGAGWEDHWGIAVGSFVGSLAGILIFALLRSADPQCTDPRSLGRSAVLVGACWVGGLGIGPATIGVATWIVVYFSCMVGNRLTRQAKFGVGSTPQSEERVPAVLAVPLVTAIAASMAASLVVRG